MIRSDLCDYNDAYIVVKGTISITGNTAKVIQKQQVVYGIITEMN